MMLIRQARIADLDQLYQIEKKVFVPEEAASKEALLERLMVTPDTVLVAEINREVTAFIAGQVVTTDMWDDTIFTEARRNSSKGGLLALTSLAVAPTYQGQGIGMALLAAMKDLAVAKDREGIILTCHEHLIAYYEWNGFEDQGESLSQLGDSTWYQMIWHNPDCLGKDA